MQGHRCHWISCLSEATHGTSVLWTPLHWRPQKLHGTLKVLQLLQGTGPMKWQHSLYWWCCASLGQQNFGIYNFIHYVSWDQSHQCYTDVAIKQNLTWLWCSQCCTVVLDATGLSVKSSIQKRPLLVDKCKLHCTCTYNDILNHRVLRMCQGGFCTCTYCRPNSKPSCKIQHILWPCQNGCYQYCQQNNSDMANSWSGHYIT